MKQPAKAERDSDQHAEKVFSNVVSPPDSERTGLSEKQKFVLDRLQATPGGMTVKQLEACLSCPAEELQAVLDDLLKLNLVSRLNTIIPSYASKYPGIRVYAE